jgi:uncharacterized protein (DUF1697 family)
MHTYISVLRGINVGGHRRILMSDLIKLYEELSLKNISTYIQSGNVVFSANEEISTRELSKIIEHKIAERFGFDVPVIVRTFEQLQQIIRMNPFLERKMGDPEKCYVTFLSEIPGKKEFEAISTIEFKPDEYIIIDQDIFLYIPDRYSDTKLSNDFFERNLHVKATCRNWRTVVALAGIAMKNANV